MICSAPRTADNSMGSGILATCRKMHGKGSEFRFVQWHLLILIWPLFISTAPAQANLFFSNNVQTTCGSSAILSFQFKQPSPANVFSLQFDLRYEVAQFQTLFSDDGNPDNDKPIIKKISGALPDHSVEVVQIPENDPTADSNPDTAQWRITIWDQSSPFALIPEGTLLSMQFFTAATAENGAHDIEIASISGSDDTGNAIWTLIGANGQITLGGCSPPGRLFLPALMKQ